MPDDPQPKPTIADIDRSPLNTPEDARGSVDYKSLYTEFQQKFTEVSNENFSLKEDIDKLRTRVKTAETLDRLIEPYAAKAFWFMVFYCLAAGTIIVYDALAIKGFHLADSVLAILVGSTAVSVIGLVGMVLTGIFVGARAPK